MLTRPSLASLLVMSGNTNSMLDSHTALHEPIHWAWLLIDASLRGFGDWFVADKEHYQASEEPLKLSNLDDDLLLPLRGSLGNLESTRKDVFPLKRDGYIWERLVQSFKNSSLPFESQKTLSSLTSTAKGLTADFNDGFGHETGTPRGSLNTNNAFTTRTYTLKSIVGTHCGINPLAADFNVDTDHHIYQPCLPHIFEALNQLDHGGDEASGEPLKSFKWKTAFMQSVAMRYDKQDHLTPKIGLTDPLGWWELEDEAAKLGPVNLTDVNYYGMPEVAIEDYLRDVFASAKKNNERVFLSHLTSSTHHGFGIPTDEEYVSLAGDTDHDKLSHYLNVMGYVGRWLNKILEILDEQDVAGETLVVAVGDDGLSIAERGTITAYSNPHVANCHTKSLSLSKARAVHDMVRNYKSQSLLRSLQKFSKTTGQGGWQFTVMNPGGLTIARFTDLETDPHEQAPLLSYDYTANLRSVEAKFGSDAAMRVEEAAAVTRGWTDENYKRWRYPA
ncbi:alkaline-phosphatase-like protein [Trichoderma sp. SZMC 28012]